MRRPTALVMHSGHSFEGGWGARGDKVRTVDRLPVGCQVARSKVACVHVHVGFSLLGVFGVALVSRVNANRRIGVCLSTEDG